MIYKYFPENSCQKKILKTILLLKIATPADAALMMHLGVDGIFVGSGIFESSDPDKMAKAICLATTYYNDYNKLTDACDLSGIPMMGIGENEVENRYELR